MGVAAGSIGGHWGGGCRKIRNFRVLLMHWTGGWLSGEEEHFESSEKSSCASEPLRAPTTDYQVHRGGREFITRLEEASQCICSAPPKTDFLREKTVWRKCSFPALPEQ